MCYTASLFKKKWNTKLNKNTGKKAKTSLRIFVLFLKFARLTQFGYKYIRKRIKVCERWLCCTDERGGGYHHLSDTRVHTLRHDRAGADQAHHEAGRDRRHGQQRVRSGAESAQDEARVGRHQLRACTLQVRAPQPFAYSMAMTMNSIYIFIENRTRINTNQLKRINENVRLLTSSGWDMVLFVSTKIRKTRTTILVKTLNIHPLVVYWTWDSKWTFSKKTIQSLGFQKKISIYWALSFLILNSGF